eukprot:694700-Rhodomonas_salina.1
MGRRERWQTRAGRGKKEEGGSGARSRSGRGAKERAGGEGEGVRRAEQRRVQRLGGACARWVHQRSNVKAEQTVRGFGRESDLRCEHHDGEVEEDANDGRRADVHELPIHHPLQPRRVGMDHAQ